MKTESGETRTVAIAALFAVATVVMGMSSGYVGNYREQMITEASEQSFRAAEILDAVTHTPGNAIAPDLLTRAKAVVVFPHVTRAWIELEGEGSPGVVCRQTARGWGSPVFLRGGSGRVAPPIGSATTDYVLLLMTDRSVDGLMKTTFELGADALSYSRNRTVVAGANATGVVLRPEDRLNMAVYSETAREMLSGHLDESIRVSGRLNAFPQALGRYTVTSGRAR